MGLIPRRSFFFFFFFYIYNLRQLKVRILWIFWIKFKGIVHLKNENRRPKKWRVARSFDRAGIAWLLVEGSKSSFISWSKLKITWHGKWYVRICSSGILNKLIRVEKTLSPLPRALGSLWCLLLATIIAAISSAKQFKTCFFWGVK